MNGLLISMRALDIICRYTSVEFGLRCPKSCWMNVWLIPSSRAWQAKQCRRVCGVTPSGRPSLRFNGIRCQGSIPYGSGKQPSPGTVIPVLRDELKVAVSENGVPVLPVLTTAAHESSSGTCGYPHSADGRPRLPSALRNTWWM